MAKQRKPSKTTEEIQAVVQERIKTVREMLGEDFPMLDWYLAKYEDYYTKTQTLEALTNAAQRDVYVLNVSSAISIAIVAPVDADIVEETKKYPPLFEKNDIYGFILYLVNTCGYEIMHTAYSFNAQAYIQAANYTRKAKAEMATAIGQTNFENEDEQFAELLNNLTEEQSQRFANMMLKTEMLDYAEFDETLDEHEKQVVEQHNKQIQLSVDGLKKAIEERKKANAVSSKVTQYASDGYNMSANNEYVVLLSGYPSNEMMHRYVGIGSRAKMDSLMKDIQAALDAGIIDIPYCGTVPESMRKTNAPVKKGDRGGMIHWIFGPQLYSFGSIKEARLFAAQYDHHYSETGYLLQ